MPAYHGSRSKKSFGKKPAPFKPKDMHRIGFDCLPKVAEDADELAGLNIVQRWRIPHIHNVAFFKKETEGGRAKSQLPSVSFHARN